MYLYLMLLGVNKMAEKKITEFYLKLKLDAESFKMVDTQLKNMAKSFKSLESKIEEAGKGIQSKIRMAFFGKTGSNTTISSFFRTEFKNMATTISNEFKSTMTTVAAQVQKTNDVEFGKIVNTMIKHIQSLEKQTISQTEKSKSNIAKIAAGAAAPFGAKYLSAKDYRSFSGNKFFRQEPNLINFKILTPEQNIATKMALEQDLYIAKEMEKTKKSIDIINKNIITVVKKMKSPLELINEQFNVQKSAALQSMAKYYGDIERKQIKELNKLEKRVKEAVKKVTNLGSGNIKGFINDSIINKGNRNVMQDMKDYYTKQSKDTLMSAIKLDNLRASNYWKTQEKMYQGDLKIENAKKKALMDNIKLGVQAAKNYMDYQEKIYKNEQRIVKQSFNVVQSGTFDRIKNKMNEFFVNSSNFKTTYIKMFEGVYNAFKNILTYIKTFSKLIIGIGVSGVAAFTGLSIAIKSFGLGIITTTDKMRGFEIGLLGMMKTMPAVNKLMEASFKVAEKLPISYEEVYQSTKAFALITPLRTMLQDSTKVHETLKDAYQVIMALSQIEPEWGIAGAQFSFREALSGDLRSLQRRFEIPVNLIFDEKGTPITKFKNNPEAILKTLSKYLSNLYDKASLEKASRQFSVQINKIEGEWFKFQQTIGQSGFYDKVVDKIINIRKQIELFTSTQTFQKFTKSISNSLSSIIDTTENLLIDNSGGLLKLLGITPNIESITENISNVFETITAAYRTFQKTIMSNDVKNFIKNTMEFSKKMFESVYEESVKLFKGVKADLKLVADVLNNTLFPIVDKLVGLGTSDIIKRGVLYSFLFGPGNIINILLGFSMSLKTAIEMMNMLGLSGLKTIASIAGKITLAIASIMLLSDTVKIIFASIDKSIEGTTFYKMWAWLTGKETVSKLESKLSSLLGNFKDAISSIDNKTIISTISKSTGLKEDIVAKKYQNADFLVTIGTNPKVKKSLLNIIHSELDFIRNHYANVSEKDIPKLRARETELLFSEKKISAVFDNIDKSKDILIKIAEKLNNSSKTFDQLDLNLYIDKITKSMESLKNSGIGVFDTVKEYLKPMEADGEAQLKLIAKELIKSRPDAISGLTRETKIAGARLVDIFKNAGYEPIMTSGYRKGDTGSAHSVGKAIDYQLKLNGEPLSTQVLESESFVKLIKDLKASNMIQNVILEEGKQRKLSDELMNKIGQDPKLKKKGKGNEFAVLHVEIKDYIGKEQQFITDNLGFIGNIDNILSNANKIFKDEIDKGSQNIEPRTFKQPYESLIELKLFVQQPLEAFKQTIDNYEQFADILKDGGVFDDIDKFYKSFEEDNVSKFGINKIEDIKKTANMFKQKIKDIGYLSITLNTISKEFVDTAMQSKDNNIVDIALTSAPKIIKQLKSIYDLPFIIDENTNKEIARIESISTQVWKDSLRKKSYSLIDLAKRSAEELEVELSMIVASESASKAIIDSELKTNELKSFNDDLRNLLSKIYITKESIEKAAVDFIKESDTDAIKSLKKKYIEMSIALRDENKERWKRIESIKDEIALVQKMTSIKQLEPNWSEYITSSSKEMRDAAFTKYKDFLKEGQTPTGGFSDVFIAGILESQSEWLKTSQLMYETGKQLNDNLTSTFETGFFDVMTKGISSIGNMFKNLWNVVKNTILGIIAKMLAMSATKLVLGIDIQGGITGKASGVSGISSILSSVLGGGSNGSIGGIFSGMLGNFAIPSVAGGANKNTVAQMMNIGTGIVGATGGIDLTSLTRAGVAGAVAGTKGSGILGALNPVKKFIKAYQTPLLTTAAIGAFLTQPGRLFGGTKDKTKAAQDSYTLWSDRRNQLVNRQETDALNYYMSGSSITNSIMGYNFPGIGYSTWSSGDGWFKGPKEKHANTDPYAYINSLKKYFELLLISGKEHYNKMFEINKLAEINQLKSLKMQNELDKNKLDIIQKQYNYYTSGDYADPDKLAKIDEWRDNLLNAQYENKQLQSEIVKLEKETGYKQMEYLAYAQWNGENQIAMMKTNIEIERDKLKAYENGTIEWYDAKLSLMRSEKELADNLKEISKQAQVSINNGLKSIYMMGGDLSKLPSNRIISNTGIPDYSKLPKGIRPNLQIKQLSSLESYVERIRAIENLQKGNINDHYMSIGGASSIMVGSGKFYDQYYQSKYTGDDVSVEEKYRDWFNSELKRISDIGGKVIDTQWVNPEFYKNNIPKGTTPIGQINYKIAVEEMVKGYNMTVSEVIENINKEIEKTLVQYQAETNINKNKQAAVDALTSVDNSIKEQYSLLYQSFNNLMNDVYMTYDEKDKAYLEIGESLSKFYLDLANNINSFMDAGLISEDDYLVNNFKYYINRGFNEVALTLYDNIKLAANKANLKGDILTTIKDMNDFSIVNEVLNMPEMKDVRKQLNLIPNIEKYRINDMLFTKENYNLGGNFQDPYQMWFDYQKETILNRINNAERESDDWFAAQSDLFNLMIENAQKMKEKAKEAQCKMEDIFNKIEETMKMRVAEERTTQKGDIIFMDVGSSRDAQKMLDKMISAAKTNDPSAIALIEEFKKKMLGIR